MSTRLLHHGALVVLGLLALHGVTALPQQPAVESIPADIGAATSRCVILSEASNQYYVQIQQRTQQDVKRLGQGLVDNLIAKGGCSRFKPHEDYYPASVPWGGRLNGPFDLTFKIHDNSSTCVERAIADAEGQNIRCLPPVLPEHPYYNTAVTESACVSHGYENIFGGDVSGYIMARYVVHIRNKTTAETGGDCKGLLDNLGVCGKFALEGGKCSRLDSSSSTSSYDLELVTRVSMESRTCIELAIKAAENQNVKCVG